MKNQSILFYTLLLTACAAPRGEDFAAYVDPLIGSGDHGHVFVGANVPFGMVQLGPTSIPQTWDWCSGYNYADTTVIGFGHTHLSGTGIGDLNDISLMPVRGDVTLARGQADDPASGMWSFFSHDRERSEPGYYATRLERYGIDVELTATERVGLSRYTFPASDDGAVVLDLENGQGWDEAVDCGIRAVDSLSVEGWRRSTGWARDQRVYFHLEFSRPFSGCSFSGDSVSLEGGACRGRKLYARFDFADASVRPLLAKVALSAVSAENARRNLEAECPGWDFEAVRRAARERWNRELAKIRIETADPAVRRIFYTALYHTMIAPSVFSDTDGSYRGADGRVRRDTTFTCYTTFSLWDTYRAAHPLMTLIHPERVPDIINTMLHISDEQGKLPVWHLWGNETDCMVGNPAIPVVADALLKGFGGIDRAKAYEAMKRTAMGDERGLDLYKRYGYIPYEFNESVGYCLEYAIADWALAQVARQEGHCEDYAYFLARSRAYRRYFDPATGFIRGRSASGAWRTPFDPFHSRHMDQDYTEGNAWQYTWLVPHDVEGLAACFGGRERMLEKLDSLFVVEGELGAEASPDISGLVGQYAHGNEPSHHIAYLYTLLGRPWKTADRVRQILSTLYHDRPAGLCGNEDVGQMSAWYVLSALGMYQVEPAGGRYVFGSPAVDGAVVQVPGGEFRIEVRDNSPINKYIQYIALDGEPLRSYWIDHTEMTAGRTLLLQMGPEPRDWTKR
ncbi:GH92 family glycosyl hydrolase [Alistipes sp.]|uniref:GH92 family glycosyl hydrolase n=1 Tax=Alistipes sp. TaxID=1872444 RepID=UPI003AF0D185